MQVGFYDEKARHSGALYDLDGVEDRYERQIAGKCDVGAYFLRFIAIGRELGPACTADRLETRSDRNTRIEQFCLLQPVVSKVKIFAGDIKAHQGQALSCRLVEILLSDTNVTHLFAKRDRARAALKRFA